MSNQKPSSLRKLYSGSISADDLFIAVDVDELSSPTGETKTIDLHHLSRAVFSTGIDATGIQYVSASMSGSIWDVVEQKLNISEGDLLNDRIDNLNTDQIQNVSNIPTVSNYLTEALNVLYLQSRSIAVGISTTQCFTASFGQSVFPLSTDIVPQNSLVYNEGLLISNDSYTLTDNSLTYSASTNDNICVIDFGQTASFTKTFLALNDTPGTYTDNENSVVAVNRTGDALEFRQTIDNFSLLSDTPSTYSGFDDYIVVVNGDGDGLTFKSSGSFLAASLLNEADMSSASSVLGVTQQSIISYVSSSISERIIDDSTFTAPSTTNAPSQQSIVSYVASSLGWYCYRSG